MDEQKMSERLRFDVKFLLWRAEVYALPAAAIDQRFQEIHDEYLALAGGPQRRVIERQLEEWGQAVREARMAVSA